MLRVFSKGVTFHGLHSNGSTMCFNQTLGDVETQSSTPKLPCGTHVTLHMVTPSSYLLCSKQLACCKQRQHEDPEHLMHHCKMTDTETLQALA